MTLPLIALFVFAMIQFINMIFLRQKVTSACFIGMQQLAQADATESSVEAAVQSILTSRGVQNAKVQVLPSGELDTSMRGTLFSIRITAPVQNNISGPTLIPVSGNVVIEQWLYR